MIVFFFLMSALYNDPLILVDIFQDPNIALYVEVYFIFVFHHSLH